MVPFALLAAVAACAPPWTLRPIDEAGTAAGAFDASTYVDAIWPGRVRDEARASAITLPAPAAEADGPARATFVRGGGRVTSVDSRSRVRRVLVDLDPGDGRPEVALQIGPVLRGTALRDALSFIRFGDFDNQLAFADVANALHTRVLAEVLPGMGAAALDGGRLAFWGAAMLPPLSEDGLIDVVPVILEREGTP